MSDMPNVPGYHMYCGNCPFCGKPSYVLLPENKDIANYVKYKDGKLKLEEAFSSFSADDRELIKTGIHPKCWDDTFENED